jgi:hypothetical protein
METHVMKFQQLRIGQPFEYQGDFYVKSSPLVANHAETGEQKLIPRYAAIVLTDSTSTPDEIKLRRNLNSKQVQIAFDKFYDCYLDSLQQLIPGIEAQTIEPFQNKLYKARQLFLSELGLRD